MEKQKVSAKYTCIFAIFYGKYASRYIAGLQNADPDLDRSGPFFRLIQASVFKTTFHYDMRNFCQSG